MASAAVDKYAHLLAPLRDLASNWNIDVARELEDYLGALQTLEVRGTPHARVLSRAPAAPRLPPHPRPPPAPHLRARCRSHSTAARRA